MQTFLPYKDFKKSLESLDDKRLGKQRVETFQILNNLLGRPKKDGTPYKGWTNHPCCVMWRGYEDALKLYLNESINVWKARGKNNTMQYEEIDVWNIKMPWWLGYEPLHSSHRANLLPTSDKLLKKFDTESFTIVGVYSLYTSAVGLKIALSKRSATLKTILLKSSKGSSSYCDTASSE